MILVADAEGSGCSSQVQFAVANVDSIAIDWTVAFDDGHPKRLATFWALALGYIDEEGYDVQDGASLYGPGGSPKPPRRPAAIDSQYWRRASLLIDRAGNGKPVHHEQTR